MLPMNRRIEANAALYLNKNIYDRRNLLIWPAYTRVTPELLMTAEKRGIRISEDDVESGNAVLLRTADAALEELGEIFRTVGETGKANLDKLTEQIVPDLVESLTSASLTHLLVHLEKKDDYTLRHSVGVAALSIMLGRRLNFPEPVLQDLAVAALLHDIGKLRIDRCLVNKPGKLTPDEFEEMKKHTVYGYELLQRIEGVPESFALVALRHHERLDGSGYPSGLSGYQLEPFSRIISIADVFHAMSSRRPYKEGLPFYQVLRELRASAFGQFDPFYALTFLQIMMEALVGTEVTLSNGEKGRIVALPSPDPLQPLVQVNGRYLDLSKHLYIYILGFGS